MSFALGRLWWHGIMADEEKFMRWKIIASTVYDTLKTDTKYSHNVRGRPTPKDEERFRNGLVGKSYERTFKSEPFCHREPCYINWAI